MEDTPQKEKLKALSRFDKVLQFYWDGIPVPMMTDVDREPKLPFTCRRLAYTPNYDGETASISLVDYDTNPLFECLSETSQKTTSVSSRVGSYYSPFVGTFQFREKSPSPQTRGAEDAEKLRIPVEQCREEEDAGVELEYAAARMERFTERYAPLMKEYLPLPRQSLRRILILATIGCEVTSRELVSREVCDANDEYARALGQAVFFYMCVSKLYRHILEPLALQVNPQMRPHRVLSLSAEERAMSKSRFNESRTAVGNGLLWGPSSRSFFLSVENCWEEKLRRIAFFRLPERTQQVNASDFISEAAETMKAAFARIRIEFYSDTEDAFFSYIKGAHRLLTMAEEEFPDTIFHRVFVATEVFLARRVRELVLGALEKMRTFFDCNGSGCRRKIKKYATRHSLIQVNMVIGDNYEPRTPGLALLRLGMLELITDMKKLANSMPKLECAILRTMKLPHRQFHVIAEEDVAKFRSEIMYTLDNILLTMESLCAAYKKYTTLPSQNLPLAKAGDVKVVVRHIGEIRQAILEIQSVSADIVYCGVVAMDCTSVKTQLTLLWEGYLDRVVAEFQSYLSERATIAITEAEVLLAVMRATPSSVHELEHYLATVKNAVKLAEKLRQAECQELIDKIGQLESVHIPLKEDVYAIVLSLMKIPNALLEEADREGGVREHCGPLLKEKLNRLRQKVRSRSKTLSTGVTELYNMFNMDTCDIAAQTCTELRELVDQISEIMLDIAEQETILGEESTEKFDEFYTLLNYFETIEQFWLNMFESLKLKEYYVYPLASLNVDVMVERVRKWRRLIHASVRSLRGFPTLVRMGKEQEVGLAKFEELEEFLQLISTPGLRKSHWREISKLAEASFRDDIALVVDMGGTLKQMLDAGLLERLDELRVITSQAQSDHRVESLLEEMRSSAKRTHFSLECSAPGNEMSSAIYEATSMTIVSPQNRAGIFQQLETFIRECRRATQQASLGPLVLKSLTEWEVMTVKTRDTFLAWKEIEDRWGRLYVYYNRLKQSQRKSARKLINLAVDHSPIIEQLEVAAGAFDGLHAVLRKPQFSLYTAIAQETIQEFLFTAKSSMDTAVGLLLCTLEAKCVACPRLRFLTPEELVALHCADDANALTALLQRMYPGLGTVEVQKQTGDIVGIHARESGSPCYSFASHLVQPSCGAPEVWLLSLEHAIREAFFDALRECCVSYHQVDLALWLEQWCSAQIVTLALQIELTKAVRTAVELKGSNGLLACRTQVEGITTELQHLVALQPLTSTVRNVAAVALVELYAMGKELEACSTQQVSSLAALDACGLRQVALTQDGIVTRVLGLDVAYHGALLDLNPDILSCSSPLRESGVAVVAMLSLTSAVFPILRVDSDVTLDMVLNSMRMNSGNVVWQLRCGADMCVAAFSRVLRACMECGMWICVERGSCLPDRVMAMMEYVMKQMTASTDAVAAMEEGGTKNRSVLPKTAFPLDFPSKETPTMSTQRVHVHPQFRLFFTEAKTERIPLQLRALGRVIDVPSPSIEEMVAQHLRANAVNLNDPLFVREFCCVYETLSMLRPAVFRSRRRLITILRATTALASNDIALNGNYLLIALERVCHAALGDGDEAAHLLRSVLPASTSSCDSSSLSALTERFQEMMQFSRRALLVGPAFSGKGRLWQSWAGSRPYTILSPSFMTSADMYGTAQQPGFLPTLTSSLPDSEDPLLVLHDVDTLSAAAVEDLMVGGWIAQRSVPAAPDCTCTIPSTLQVIATARSIRNMSPSVVGGCAMLALPAPSDWKQGLEFHLRGVPEHQVAVEVIALLLPVLVKRVQRHVPGVLPTGLDSMSLLLATGQRAAVFTCRWFSLFSTPPNGTEKTPTAATDADEDAVHERRLLVARCAVFAACWTIGLALPPARHYLVDEVLRHMRTKLVELLHGCTYAEDLLPPLPTSPAQVSGDGTETEDGASAKEHADDDEGKERSKASAPSKSVMEMVALPQGWKVFEEAAASFPTSGTERITRSGPRMSFTWSKYSSLNARTHAWAQYFRFSSRQPAMCAIECLLNSNQHVLVRGEAGCGKTSLLRLVRHNERWEPTFLDANADARPLPAMEKIVKLLSKRGDGRYGPSLGRRMVVCIDDLHLSPAVSSDAEGDTTPQLSQWVDFCERFRSFSVPQMGTIPVEDVVLCGSALPETAPRSLRQLRSAVEVFLPPMDSNEVAAGVGLLFDQACGKRRIDGLAQQCARFVDMVHSVYVLLSQGMEPFRFAPRRGEDGEIVTEGKTWSSLFALHLREGLRATEMARLHLLSNISDFHVALRLFTSVGSFYVQQLYLQKGGDACRKFHDALAEAAEETLQAFVGTHAQFSDMAQQPALAPCSMEEANPFDEDRVANWASEYELTIDDIQCQLLEELDGGRFRAADAGEETTKGRVKQAAWDSEDGSVLMTYPSSLREAGLRGDGGHTEGLLRRSSATFSAGGSRRNSSSALGVHRRSSQQITQPMVPRLKRYVRRTLPTAWFTTRVVTLLQTVGSPESHTILIGHQTFGLRRLLRVVCSVHHIPLVYFQDRKTDFIARCTARDFRRQLRGAVEFVCANNVHAVIFIPQTVLRIPGAAALLDTLIRSGDVSDLFSDEERRALLSGFHGALQRSLRPFALTDDSDLRRRLRSSFNVVLQIDDEDTLQQLSRTYHFVSTCAHHIPLTSPSLQLRSERQLMQAILCPDGEEDGGLQGITFGGWAGGGEKLPISPLAKGIRKGATSGRPPGGGSVFTAASFASSGASFDDDGSMADSEAYCAAVSTPGLLDMMTTAFTFVVTRHPATTVEQLLEFAALIKELRATKYLTTLQKAREMSTISTREEAISAQLRADREEMKEFEQETSSTEHRLAHNKKKLCEEERIRVTRDAEARKTEADLAEKQRVVEGQQRAIAAGLQTFEGVLEAARHRLRTVKTTHVRFMSASRLPEKGIIVVRAVYKLLGEDPPKCGNNSHEVWNVTMRRICTAECIQQLARLAPAGVTEVLPLLPFEEELSSLRFTALPFAQLLVDYMAAFIACARHLKGPYVQETQLLEGLEADVRTAEAVHGERLVELEEATRNAEATQRGIEELNAQIRRLREQEAEVQARSQRLSKYVDLLDGFMRYASKGEVRRRVAMARRAAVDLVLTAAYFTLIAMHGSGAEETFIALESLLIEDYNRRSNESDGGVPSRTSPPIVEKEHGFASSTLPAPLRSVMPFIFPCDVQRMQDYLLTGLPWQHIMAMASLSLRLLSRWPLFGSVCDHFELFLESYLSITCKGCVIVSALDPNARARIAAAMRDGEGVLLRDVHSCASVQLVKEIGGLLEVLTTARRSVIAAQVNSYTGGVAAAAVAAMNNPNNANPPIKEEVARISYVAFGSTVQVHPDFYLIATCAAPIPAEPSLCVSTAFLEEVTKYFAVTNLTTPVSDQTRTERVLERVVGSSAVSTKLSALHEESLARRKKCHTLMSQFALAFEASLSRLATDLDVVGDDGDELLVVLEATLTDVEALDAQMAQSVAYIQSVRKQSVEVISVMRAPLEAFREWLMYVEQVKRGRPWHQSLLDTFTRKLSILSPLAVRRIAPQNFADLPLPHKYFYMVVNHVYEVVEHMSGGWPHLVRGFYALLALSSAVCAEGEVIPSQRGVLFGESVELLNPVQHRVLLQLIKDEDGALATSRPLEERKRFVKKSYTASGDAILARINTAGAFPTTPASATLEVECADLEETTRERASSPWSATFHITQLFTALAELNIEQAELRAMHLYRSFMEAALEAKAGAASTAAASVAGDARSEDMSDAAAKRRSVTNALHHKRTSTRVTLNVAPSVVTDDGRDPAMRDGEVEKPPSTFLSGSDSVETFLQRSAKYFVPLCLRVETEDDVQPTLKWAQLRVATTGWAQRWCTVPYTLDEAQDIYAALRPLLELLEDTAQWKQQQHRGLCFLVALEAPRLVDGDDKNRDVSDGQESVLSQRFVSVWHYAVSLFSFSMRRAAAAVDDPYRTPSVCLAFVCSSKVLDALHKSAVPGCLYVTTTSPFRTPQQTFHQLLSQRLQQKPHIGRAETLCQALLDAFTNWLVSIKKQQRQRIEGSTSHSSSSMSLIDAQFNIMTTMLPQLIEAVSNLCGYVRVLSMQMAVAYMALVARRQVQKFMAACEADNIPRTGEDDDGARAVNPRDPTLIAAEEDQLLSVLDLLLGEWVRAQCVLLMDKFGLGGPARDMVDSTSASREKAKENIQPGMDMEASQGRRAYYYFRNTRPSWRRMLQSYLTTSAPMDSFDAHFGDGCGEESVIPGVKPGLLSMAMGGSSGSSVAVPSYIDPGNEATRPIQSLRRPVVQALQGHWGSTLFSTFRKLAYVMFTQDSVKGGVVPAAERQAIWTMLCSIVGRPVETDTLPCLWGAYASASYAQVPAASVLRWSVVYPARLAIDVARFEKDMAELCGEKGAVRAYRRARYPLEQQLFFGGRRAASSLAGTPRAAEATAAEKKEAKPVTPATKTTLAEPLSIPHLIMTWEAPRAGTQLLFNVDTAAPPGEQLQESGAPPMELNVPALQYPLVDAQLLASHAQAAALNLATTSTANVGKPEVVPFSLFPSQTSWLAHVAAFSTYTLRLTRRSLARDGVVLRHALLSSSLGAAVSRSTGWPLPILTGMAMAEDDDDDPIVLIMQASPTIPLRSADRPPRQSAFAASIVHEEQDTMLSRTDHDERVAPPELTNYHHCRTGALYVRMDGEGEENDGGETNRGAMGPRLSMQAYSAAATPREVFVTGIDAAEGEEEKDDEERETRPRPLRQVTSATPVQVRWGTQTSELPLVLEYETAEKGGDTSVFQLPAIQCFISFFRVKSV